VKVKDALKITDSFTKTSKMPGLSYSLASLGMSNWREAQEDSNEPVFWLLCYEK
jgi:hypothetical protein